MSNWGFWDWVGFACIGIAALGLAMATALKEHPAMIERFPNLFAGPFWGYVPITLFVVGSVILAFRAWGPGVPNPSPTAEPSAAARIFVSVTPDYLMDLGKGDLHIQKQRIHAPYIGKWMRVSGPISNVRNIDTLKHSGLVTLSYPDHRTLTLLFNKEWAHRLEVLRKDQIIHAVGRISDISGQDLTLNNSEIID